jgi:hypothetical protein
MHSTTLADVFAGRLVSDDVIRSQVQTLIATLIEACIARDASRDTLGWSAIESIQLEQRVNMLTDMVRSAALTATYGLICKKHEAQLIADIDAYVSHKVDYTKHLNRVQVTSN